MNCAIRVTHTICAHREGHTVYKRKLTRAQHMYITHAHTNARTHISRHMHACAHVYTHTLARS